MTQYKRIEIDTPKAVFTLHGIDQHDRPVLRINLRRAAIDLDQCRTLPDVTEAKLAVRSGSVSWFSRRRSVRRRASRADGKEAEAAEDNKCGEAVPCVTPLPMLRHEAGT